MKKKTFLLLQGVSSPFFGCLSDRLVEHGHVVHKINFNMGDVAYWGKRRGKAFRGHIDELPSFIAEYQQCHSISDQVLFGDCRPVHRHAIEQARKAGIRNHVFEEGYIRPHWITLEREGVNGYSLLPRDPKWFREVGPHMPTTVPFIPCTSTFFDRAMHDVAYHTAGMWNWLFFPHYRTHAPFSAPVEYAGYARRLPKMYMSKKHEEESCAAIIKHQNPYYLLLLQLNNDSQIMVHSNFDGMIQVLKTTITSFAHYAPSDARLVIKNHPLDVGLVNFPYVISQLEKSLGIVPGRLIFFEGKHLGELCSHAKGVITANSTSGLVALGLDRPLISLANPIYNIPGLTFQGHLDEFWQHGETPDSQLYQYFHNTLMHTTQINGGFYNSHDIHVAVENAVPALISERSPLEQLL